MRMKVIKVARTGVLPSLAEGEGLGCRDLFCDVSWEGESGALRALAETAQLRASDNSSCYGKCIQPTVITELIAWQAASLL
jgi:hypothetical protein